MVTIQTLDRRVVQILMDEYQGPLFEHQMTTGTPDNELRYHKVYRIEQLDKQKTMRCIMPYDGCYAFAVLDSDDTPIHISTKV